MDSIIQAVDEEIAKLQEVRRLIAGNMGAKATAAKVAKVGRPRKKRKALSAEARARIAEAQRKRWARQKKS